MLLGVVADGLSWLGVTVCDGRFCGLRVVWFGVRFGFLCLGGLCF